MYVCVCVCVRMHVCVCASITHIRRATTQAISVLTYLLQASSCCKCVGLMPVCVHTQGGRGVGGRGCGLTPQADVHATVLFFFNFSFVLSYAPGHRGTGTKERGRERERERENIFLCP